MYGEEKNRMQCADFEALMAEALDGTLTGERLDAFEAHRAVCPNCAPMYAEAEAGLHWLELLQAEDAEPPARLMDNILKATSWAELPTKEARQSWWQRWRELPGLAPVVHAVAQPRFAMSFAMAFFSVTMLFTITGFKVRDLRHLDLSPSGVVETFYKTQGKVVSYYENIRWVYEIESKVRDLKRATTPEEPERAPEKRKHQNENRSGQPEPDKYRNYSLDEARPLLAVARGAVRQNDRRWL